MNGNGLDEKIIWVVAILVLWARVIRLEKRVGIAPNEKLLLKDIYKDSGILIVTVIIGLYVGFHAVTYFLK